MLKFGMKVNIDTIFISCTLLLMGFLQKIMSHFGTKPFSRTDLTKLGITRNKLQLLIQKDEVQKISRGVYQIAGSNLSDEELFQGATIRVGKQSAICLLSALAYYNLTDQIPKKIWIMLPARKRSIHKDLRVFRSRNPKWKIGIADHKNFKITTIERTIVESLVNRKILGSTVVMEALRKALKEKKTNLNAILEMGKKLNLDNRIFHIIEAFA